jgi:prepilin-type N-terminal cleavage/methylation domain-containing protein
MGRTAAGFTILELVIALTVLAILAAMVLPAFGRTYRDAVLRADARKVAAAMGLAYSQSVTSGRVHRLRLDGAERRFWIEHQDEGGERGFVPALGIPGVCGELDGAAVATLREPARDREDERAGPREDALEPPREEQPEDAGEADGEKEVPAIAFRPDGTADAREVLLEDADGFALAVRVHPATSRIRVIEVDRKALP